MKNNASLYLDKGRIYHSLRIFSILIFVFLFAGTVSAKTAVPYSQQTRISLTVKNKTIKEVFREIENKSQFIFIYNDKVIDAKKKVSVTAKDETVDQILQKVLIGTDATYKISDRQIIILNAKDPKKESGSVDNSASTSVSGVVVDPNNEPLAGVTISLKGTSEVYVSDFKGQFSLKIPLNATLAFSFIGYKSQNVKVTKEVLKIEMAEDTKLMDEIVVVGYGIAKKNDLTGAISSLKEKDFNKGVLTSPTDMIQGRVAGVAVTNNGGEPGSGVSVRIRGANSIRSGQDPLYVVDGIPLDVTAVQPAGASIAGVGDAGNKNPLNFLNPDDIESIDILKDASATAIYGSRGANGVVLVTTKKGKEGKTSINYSAYAGYSTLPSKYSVLNASEYNAARLAKSLAADDKGYNTDWQDQIFRSAFTQNHALSFGAGNKNSNYRASLSYMKEDGIIKKTGMEKFTGRINASLKGLKDHLLLEFGLTAARTNDQRAPLGQSGGVEGDLLLSALKSNPTYPVYNADGTFYQVSNQVRNPLSMISLTNDNTQTDRILANVTGTLFLFKGLNYKMNVAFDQTKAVRKVDQNYQLAYLSDGGTVDINNVEAGSSLIENYLTYDFNSAPNHKVNLLAGHSFQRFKIYTYGLSETGFSTNDIEYVNSLALSEKSDQASVTSDITINELQSFFGRVNYNLLDKYLITANFRADGSTKFGSNNKYGYFPSTAFAWRMNEEEFIKKLNVFSNLKMRLGWGITGNQEIPSKISQASLGTTSGAVLDGGSTITPGITVLRTPNPNLKWETTSQYNGGFDFGFFDGRLSGSVDVYSKSTSNVLLQVTSTMPSPAAQVWENVPGMKIQNKGIELALNGVLISKSDLTWSVGGNFSTYSNRVTNMNISSIPTDYPSGPGITGTASQVIMNNEPIGTFYGYKFLGFDANGKSIFKTDANGKAVKEVIGHALPKFTYNLTTNLAWKRFDLSLNFNGVYGNDVYNNLANIMNQMTLFSSGWNTTASAIKSTESLTNVLDYSSRFIESGSYLRLSNATVGYNVKLSHSNWLTRLRVYASGNNLFTITKYSGYDPEVSAERYSNGVPSIGVGWTSYPKARVLTFGVNAEF